MTADIWWPDQILNPSSIRAAPSAQTISGGRTLSGLETVIQSDSGFWTITLTEVPINTVEQVLCWQGIEARLSGRYGTILVPLYSKLNAPFPVGMGIPADLPGLPFSAGQFFASGVGFRNRRIIVKLVNSLNIGDTTAVIRLHVGSDLRAGQIFGDEANEYAYKITKCVLRRGTIHTYDCSIWPQARAMIPKLTYINMDNPRVRCRLQMDAGMDATFQYGKFARPSVTFEEDV